MSVHDSQGYRKIDVTRARISRIFELTEILLLKQIGFNLINAAVICYLREYLRLGTLVSYNRAQVFEACGCREPQFIHFELCGDATSVVCHQLGLLSIDPHAG